MITDEERESLSRMTEPQIRRAQSLVSAQIRMAYEQKNYLALTRLREWEDSYTEEMLRRC